MKITKPNITEGDWNFEENEILNDWTIRTKAWGRTDCMGDYRGNIICSFSRSHGGRKHAYPEVEKNAQAIAQVPNMLDALIDAYYREFDSKEAYEELGMSGFANACEAQIKWYKQVLLDAGCTFEEE